MLKREWGAEGNGNLLHLFIPSKTANLVPEFAVEDLPLGRTAALVPEFAVKDLPLGTTLDDDDKCGVGESFSMVNPVFPLHKFQSTASSIIT